MQYRQHQIQHNQVRMLRKRDAQGSLAIRHHSPIAAPVQVEGHQIGNVGIVLYNQNQWYVFHIAGNLTPVRDNPVTAR